MRRVLLVGALALLLVPAAAGSEQVEPVEAVESVEPSRPFAWDVTRAVLIDPTTYAPAIISHAAMMSDWKTSQVLFAHGWYETNPRFTVTGLPADVPVSYSEGKQRIQSASWKVLQYSLLNNAAVGVGERLLAARYPRHKSLIKAVSWIERIAFASFITYRNSAEHLRQAGENRRLAREFGYAR